MYSCVTTITIFARVLVAFVIVYFKIFPKKDMRKHCIREISSAVKLTTDFYKTLKVYAIIHWCLICAIFLYKAEHCACFFHLRNIGFVSVTHASYHLYHLSLHLASSVLSSLIPRVLWQKPGNKAMYRVN